MSLDQPYKTISFIIGEQPEPLQWQYLDANDNPIPLDESAAVVLRMKRRDSAAENRNAEVVDAAAGKVRYVWEGADLEVVGVLTCVFWTDTGSLRLASDEIRVRCFASSPGPPASPYPTV